MQCINVGPLMHCADNQACHKFRCKSVNLISSSKNDHDLQNRINTFNKTENVFERHIQFRIRIQKKIHFHDDTELLRNHLETT